MTDTHNAEPPHADPGGPPATRLEVQGGKNIPPRRFTPNALREIHALLCEGPFDNVEWQIADQQGVHTSTDLDALLKNVFWRSVERFQIFCYRSFRREDELTPLPPSVPANHLSVLAYYKTEVRWSSAPQNRQRVELTFTRLVDFLQHLPAKRGLRSAFVDSLPEAQQPTKAWWNLLRAPRSMLDWAVVSLLGGLAVVVAVALLARML